MQEQNLNNNPGIDDEISLKELIEKIQEAWKYLLAKWYLIGLIAFIGASIGVCMAWVKPIKYTARLSFVAEESKSSIGGLASLAGQFGFDVGGGTGGGVFAGENILLFLKSENLIRETLMTPYSDAAHQTLADKYAEVNELKKSWAKNEKIGSIDFSKYTEESLPRKEDSLLQTIVTDIQKEFSVAKTDKKASFIEVKTTTRDELLSQLFTERLVKTGTDWYVKSKTKVKADNVALLQHRADSLGTLLNRNTYSAAAAQQSLVDVNPALRTAPVTAEITARDKTMIATIFAEVIKNLELAKFSLSQETPVIQVVDKSSFPLKKEKESKLKALLLGGFLGFFLAIAYLLAKKWWASMMQ
jgi:hypothetical protein